MFDFGRDNENAKTKQTARLLGFLPYFLSSPVIFIGPSSQITAQATTPSGVVVHRRLAYLPKRTRAFSTVRAHAASFIPARSSLKRRWTRARSDNRP